jgi:hypothetical protein
MIAPPTHREQVDQRACRLYLPKQRIHHNTASRRSPSLGWIVDRLTGRQGLDLLQRMNVEAKIDKADNDLPEHL